MLVAPGDDFDIMPFLPGRSTDLHFTCVSLPLLYRSPGRRRVAAPISISPNRGCRDDDAWRALPSLLLQATFTTETLTPLLLRGNAPSILQYSTLLVTGDWHIFSTLLSLPQRNFILLRLLTAKIMGHSVHAHPTSSRIAVGGYERRSWLPSSTLPSICVGSSHELDPAALLVTQTTTPKTTVYRRSLLCYPIQ